MRTTRLHLVHGWTYSVDNWADFIDSLKQSGFEPVLHKLPGLTSPSEQVWTIQSYVEWLHEQIGSEQQIVFIGHSNGGRLCLAYAQSFPEQVHQLILIGSAGIPDARLMIKHRRRLKVRLGKLIKRSIPNGRIQKVLHRRFGAPSFDDNPPNMQATLRNMQTGNQQLKLEHILTPSTLIWGQYDSIIPLSFGLRMRDQLPHVVSWNVLKAGHTPQVNHAAEVAAIITRDVNGLLE